MAACHHKVLPSSKVFSNPVQVVADRKEVDRVVRVLLLEVVHRLLVEGFAGHPLAQASGDGWRNLRQGLSAVLYIQRSLRVVNTETFQLQKEVFFRVLPEKNFTVDS